MSHELRYTDLVEWLQMDHWKHCAESGTDSDNKNEGYTGTDVHV
jgi:hypothetical protein